jgi:hypothetical protein
MDQRIYCQLQNTTSEFSHTRINGTTSITKDGDLACSFKDLRSSGIYNLTLFINNEDMSERVLTTVSLFTSCLVQENLLMTSPARQFFNLTKQLLTQTLQLSFSPTGPLLALADPSKFTLLLNNRTYTPSSTMPFTFAVPLTDLSSLLTSSDY